MRRVVFHRFAERELAEAVDYYNHEKPALGFEFRSEVEQAARFLSQYPRAAPLVRAGVRRFVLPRFPYSLLYREVDLASLRVLAVAHHKRDPEYWAGRR